MNIKIPLILITILTSLVYTNTLKNSFVWDDSVVIVKNDFIKSWNNFPRIFTKGYLTSVQDFDYLGKKDIGSGETRYRPLVTVSYFIDYAVWKLNPFGFHFTSLLLHIINVILLFYLVFLITKNQNIALCVSLLFALHPVNSETVNVISFRDDLLAFLFFTTSFILFIKFNAAAAVKKSACYIASLFLFLLALFSKEMAVTLPLVLILYDYFFVSRNRLRFRRAYFGYAGVLLFYAGVRFILMPNIDGEFTAYPGGSFWTNLFTMCRVFFGYLKWLIFPVNIHPIAPSDTSLISSAFTDPNFLMALFAATVFFTGIAVVDRKSKLMAFAAAYFFITLLPVSNLFPIENYMAARYLYIPMAGFCIFISAVLFGLPWRERVKSGLLVIILVFYAIFTMMLNFSWKNDAVLKLTIAEHYQDKAWSHQTLADLYRGAGLLDKSISEHKTALRLDPYLMDGYNMLGISYYEKGMIPEAIETFKRGIAINPENISLYSNLGVLYTRIKEWEKAREIWKTGLKIAPDSKEVQAHLAKLDQIGY